MIRHTFVPGLESLDGFNGEATEKEIASEPMLYSADTSLAEIKGGPLTKRILDPILRQIENTRFDGHRPIIDTRVHMLMPGMYPAIPGWHCDDWGRSRDGIHEDVEEQPHPGVPRRALVHYMGLIESSRGIAPTEFLSEPVTLPMPRSRTWEAVSKSVEALQTPRREIEAGTLYRFDCESLHRATKARRRGWRFFFRLSVRQGVPRNEIRRQAQVYTTDHGGW